MKVEPQIKTVSIDAFIEQAKGRTRALAIESIQDLNEEIVRGTGHGYGIKVVTGFLIGSWQAALNARPAASGGTPDKTGNTSVARLNLVAAGLELGDVFFSVNGAVYAKWVHYGTKKGLRPRPWVHQIVDQWPRICGDAAKRVAKL